jgi:hypothetical protein
LPHHDQRRRGWRQNLKTVNHVWNQFSFLEFELKIINKIDSPKIASRFSISLPSFNFTQQFLHAPISHSHSKNYQFINYTITSQFSFRFVSYFFFFGKGKFIIICYCCWWWWCSPATVLLFDVLYEADLIIGLFIYVSTHTHTFTIKR